MSATMNIEEAAELLGIGRGLAYASARNGSFPVALVRIGRRLLVPRAPLLRLLNGGDDGS